MQITPTVTVEFPDGPRKVVPKSWNRNVVEFLSPDGVRYFPDEPWKPKIEIPHHRIVETVDGRFIAVPDMG